MNGVEVRRGPEVPQCRRCSAEGMLACEIPGAGLHVLCQQCDISNPATGALITFLTVHAPVGPDRSEELAQLVEAWFAHVRSVPPNPAAGAEWEAWRSGEFDE